MFFVKEAILQKFVAPIYLESKWYQSTGIQNNDVTDDYTSRNVKAFILQRVIFSDNGNTTKLLRDMRQKKTLVALITPGNGNPFTLEMDYIMEGSTFNLQFTGVSAIWNAMIIPVIDGGEKELKRIKLAEENYKKLVV